MGFLVDLVDLVGFAWFSWQHGRPRFTGREGQLTGRIHFFGIEIFILRPTKKGSRTTSAARQNQPRGGGSPDWKVAVVNV